MKKLVTILMALFCAVILFFTFFGETLFYEAKPQVTTHSVYSMFTADGNTAPIIPKESLVDGEYIYVVTYIQGFSAEISSAEMREVTTQEYDDTYLLVIEGDLRNGEKVIITSDRPFNDGDKVTVVE
ncbi:MAG: hypothetical protein IJ424_06875 [Oscillospiraceae bacterium]|nr:hypothetical protein [Oscillospiraceae bacterium]